MNWYTKHRNAVAFVLLAFLMAIIGYNLFDRYYVPPLPEAEKPMTASVVATSIGDWPQWRGPHRDGVSAESGLLRTWQEGGPKLLWTFDRAGCGYSAPAVVSGKIFLPGARGSGEFLVALDAATGEELGEAVIGHTFQNDWGDGPRGTPTVDSGRVYALGGSGDLACVEPATGAVVWRRNIYRDFDGTVPFWGCTESPLADGDHVLCTPGGAHGAVIALSKFTGEPVWRCTALQDAAGFSSLMTAEVGGVRQYVQMTMESVSGVAAADGRLLWRFSRDRTPAPVPTPIVRDDRVYVTSGYGAGCVLLKLSPTAGGTTAESVYANKVMKNHHGGVVLVGDYIYGYSDNLGWTCQDFHTGKRVWNEKKKLGKGCVTAADGMLYCYEEEEGIVCLVEASPKGWREHGRFTIPQQTANPRKQGKIWTHPVIADGKLYLRDQEMLFCYEIKAP
jgi:outer membrane protein assembly factor BamB